MQKVGNIFSRYWHTDSTDNGRWFDKNGGLCATHKNSNSEQNHNTIEESQKHTSATLKGTQACT